MFSDLTQFSHFTVIFHRLSVAFLRSLSLSRHNQHKTELTFMYVVIFLSCMLSAKNLIPLICLAAYQFLFLFSLSRQNMISHFFFSLCLCCFLSNFTYSFTQHPLLFRQRSPFTIKATTTNTAFGMLHAFNKNRFFFALR